MHAGPSTALVDAARHAYAETDRRAAVLRLLGRLEFVGSHWVRKLIFPDAMNRMAAWRALDALHEDRLIWRAPLDPRKLPSAVRRRDALPAQIRPWIYGLTEAGREWLRAEGVERDPAILDTFVVRDHAKPEVKAAQLAHDLLVVDWCASAIDGARRCPLVSGIRCQLEYISAQDERGLAYQRFDALLALTFDVTCSEQQTCPGWQIPWVDRVIADDATTRTLRFAVELDRGTEKLATLMGKAVMYRQLTQAGHYDATLGGPVLPVVVAPPGRRGVQIAREWAHGWPGGLGVVTSFRRAHHAQHGALWGVYYTMTDNPARQVSLLADTGLSLRDWRGLTAHWTPGVRRGADRLEGHAAPSTAAAPGAAQTERSPDPLSGTSGPSSTAG